MVGASVWMASKVISAKKHHANPAPFPTTNASTVNVSVLQATQEIPAQAVTAAQARTAASSARVPKADAYANSVTPPAVQAHAVQQSPSCA